MADVGDRIRIKYGLRASPSLEQQRRWADAVDRYVALGYGRDLAGENAAKEVFTDYRSILLKSEADTIEMLLQRIRDK